MSLYKRADSPHWWVRFQVNGREVRLTTGTEDRKKASDFESAARGAAWQQAKLGERPPYPWSEARRRWLSETQKRSKSKDELILTWFDEHLAGVSVQEITRDVVEELRALKVKELSVRKEGRVRALAAKEERALTAEEMCTLEATSPAKATADRYMALLRAILRKCVNDWQVLTSVPKVPMYRPKVKEPRFLTQAEFARLRVELPPHLSLAAQFAVLTGLRMRSMLALTWDRIDMEAATAWIPGEQMKAGRAHGLPLSPDAVQVLKDLRELSPEGGAVFQYEGVQLADANSAAFKKAVKRAKIGILRWHDLRHTWASWAVQSGASLQQVMQLGGWASYSMVLRYAHLGPEHLADAAALVTFEKVPHENRHSKKNDAKGSSKSFISNGKGGTRTLDPGIMSAVL